MNTLNRMNMKKKGLSTIITTLIIVTASVVLGTAVVLFASGIFQGSVEEEGITVSGLKLWGNGTSAVPTSEAAFIVKNTGSKELAIQTFKVRGVEVAFEDWYYLDISGTNITTQTALEYDPVPVSTLTLTGVAINSPANRILTAATGPLGLKPGDTYVVYVATPGGLDSSDAGSSVTVTVAALQAIQVLRVTVSSP